MSIERLIKAFELEKQILGVGSDKKCPSSKIEEAEKLLGLTFPPTYRYYLEHIYLNTKTRIFCVNTSVSGRVKFIGEGFGSEALVHFEAAGDKK